MRIKNIKLQQNKLWQLYAGCEKPGKLLLMAKQPNYKEIIRFIFEQFDKETGEAEILLLLQTKYSIDLDTASWAIEMAQTGHFRSSFIKEGKKYPKSNIDNDPFLKEAIKYCY